MKLKNVLLYTFLILTFIPVVIVSLLLYTSGFGLSKASYMQNLNESINVQSDYIAQDSEKNMITDYRFSRKMLDKFYDTQGNPDEFKNELLIEFRSYLEDAEDKIAVCMLFDKDRNPLYAIGEKSKFDFIYSQLPELSELNNQIIMEFDLGDETYSLGIVTPVRDSNDNYMGSLISIYDKTYIFKIISSYYEISDTFTYLCRSNGEIINYSALYDDEQATVISNTLNSVEFEKEGVIDVHSGKKSILGYYKAIHTSPWYLVGIIDHNQIFAFLNQFVWAYILIIGIVFLIDVFLAFYFSRRVVLPINHLIGLIEGYPASIDVDDRLNHRKHEYFEIDYLSTKFINLMKKILLVQHNFEGVYQLYQSTTMDDTNIDIDVKGQTIDSSKLDFAELIKTVKIPEGACIVEAFTNCFCEKDQTMLMDMFVDMRDHHLSVTRETKVFTPYFGEKWFHVLVVPMYEDDRLCRLFIQLRDVSSYKKKEMASLEQAQRDPLTGLYNRLGFTAYVENSLKQINPIDRPGFIFIDMNDFKLVNDNFGHDAGDELLSSIGNSLIDIIGDMGVVARFGGDEFAIFIPNTSLLDLATVNDKVKSTLIYPYESANCKFKVTSSSGMSICTDPARLNIEDMLKEADVNMYQAKRDFKQAPVI